MAQSVKRQTAKLYWGLGLVGGMLSALHASSAQTTKLSTKQSLPLWSAQLRAETANSDMKGPRRSTKITGLTWSPDGKEFVFATNRGYEGKDGQYLWRVGVDGKGLVQLTFRQPVKRGKITDCTDSNPQWSPIGGKIAFDSDRGVRNTSLLTQVFICDRTGKALKQLSAGQGRFDNQHPAWSPDGRFLAWATDRSTGSGIMMATATGQELRYLAQEPQFLESYPAWSHDGKSIAYVAKRVMMPDLDEEVEQIHVLSTLAKSPTAKPRVLFQTATDSLLNFACSPTEETVAFLDPNPPYGEGVWTLQLDGTGKQQVSKVKAGDPNVRPAWSPDGKRLAFVAPTRHHVSAGVEESGIWICNLATGSVAEVPLPVVLDRPLVKRKKARSGSRSK